ncbi:mannonate dehydratase [Phytoactinopolyspora limicola]|uniref:mannonate dehydratase n=1 Tax=Phytoactinopolyspora limicola TaxID=2715536 RepID=UPI00140CC910|nr:mannonate dehydratase [Phytoactinopolyspora limicola]
MSIRLALGHIEQLDDDVVTFGQQLGLTSVHLHTPGDLSGTDGFWTADELLGLRHRCEDAGLVLEAIENVPYAHWDKVLLGLPGRDAQLENYCRTIRNMAAAGITTLGHHFLPGYVWRTDLRASGRGGALVTAYDESRVAEGNALTGYKLTPPAPVEHPLTAEQMWENYHVFLTTVLPVAEEVGVRLSLHPDDPPTTLALGGIARILSSPEGLERAYELSGGSPAWGLTLCLGSVSEMAGAQSVERVIDFFGPRNRISYVHFRDVQGTVPKFEECFLGEGNLDPAAVLRRLAATGFDGFLIDDHVPAMLGDPDTWADTSSAAYCSRGRAHAMGYLQGLLAAL